MPTEELFDKYKIEDRASQLLISERPDFEDAPDAWLPADLTVEQAYAEDWAKSRAREILRSARATSRMTRLETLIDDVKRRIAEPYQFDVFAPNSYNFGLVTTLRQCWQPLNYQAGDLAGTVPLAPNERREVTIKRLNRTESTTNRSSGRSSTRSTNEKLFSRAEEKITDKTTSKLSATFGSEGKLTLGEWLEVGGSNEFTAEQTNEAHKVKSRVREATRESAQEFKDENKIEIGDVSSSEFEETEVREISNPNSEITVTYLFYELQRRFEVSQSIYDAEPVVLVAFEVPAPHQIDEAWLLENDWIVRQVLLDPDLEPALDLLSEDMAGHEFATEIFEAQWRINLAVVNRLKRHVGAHVDLRDEARAEMRDAAERARETSEREREELGDDLKTLFTGIFPEGDQPRRQSLLGAAVGFPFGGLRGARDLGRPLTELGDGLFGRASDMLSGKEPADDMAQQVLDWTEADLARVERQLQAASTELGVATDTYVAAVRKRLNRRVQIDKLILHIRANILHYMQAIWSREHADQRYLRLYDLSIEWPIAAGPALFEPMDKDDLPFDFPDLPKILHTPEIRGRIQMPSAKFGDPRKLHQVADLDHIVGFRGNYAAFRLRETNALTDYMMQDYVDTAFGIGDPDLSVLVPTAEEALALAQCLLERDDLSDDDRKDILRWVDEVIALGVEREIEVVVPSGQLFIEALPGTHPLLEDFKLRHRGYDMQKAAAEARMEELEAERRQRLLDAGDLSDPDIDKSIRVTGIDQSSLDVDV